MPNVIVRGIEVTNQRVTGVYVGDEVLRFGAVVCAAGIHGARFAESIGVTVPIRVSRSSVAETNPARNFTRTAIWSPNVAYRPTVRGTFYLGNGYAAQGAEHDITLASLRHLRQFLPSYLNNWRRLKLSIGPEFIADLARRLRRKLPEEVLREPRINWRKISYNEQRFYELLVHLQGLGIQRAWAGRIDFTPDLIPVLGKVNGMAELCVAFGFSGHGFALGPVVGRLLSELIVDGRPSLDISAFDPRRFECGRTKPAQERL
jgi:glycine/D-amino acid oxidase-like deaminating enzyme